MSETREIRFFATVAGSMVDELGLALKLWDLEASAALIMINPSLGDELATETTQGRVTVRVHAVAFHAGPMIRLPLGEAIAVETESARYELTLLEIPSTISSPFTDPVCRIRLRR